MILLHSKVQSNIAVTLPLCALFHLASSGTLFCAQALSSKVLTLTDGMPIYLYLMDDIDSKTDKVGDVIHFKVRKGIEIGGIVVIAMDSPVVGRIVAIGRNHLMGHSGGIALSIDSAVALNGAKISLRGGANVKGGGRGATTLESAAWLGPVAYLHKGTMLNAYINGSQPVSLAGAE
jgi:hypothetical protein